MKKIIVFDFDKTLTYKDTLFGFFRFAAKKDLLYTCKIFLYILFMILAKFSFISNGKLKDIGIKLFLKDLNRNILNEKFHTYHNLIEFNKVYNNLKYEDGNEYYIISASFEDYLRPIFPGFVTILGTKLKYYKDRAHALEFNCYKENKAKVIKDLNVQKIDVLYTDSYSDYPLAKISKQIVIVSSDKEIVCNNINEFKGYFKK